MNCCARDNIWNPLDFTSSYSPRTELTADFYGRESGGLLSPSSVQKTLETRADNARLPSSDPRHRTSSPSRCYPMNSGFRFLPDSHSVGASAARLILEELRVLQASQVRVEGFLGKWIERQDALGLQLAEQQARLDCGMLGTASKDFQQKMDEERRARSRGSAHSRQSRGSEKITPLAQTTSQEPKVEDKEKYDNGMDAKRISLQSTASDPASGSPRHDKSEKAKSSTPAVPQRPAHLKSCVTKNIEAAELRGESWESLSSAHRNGRSQYLRQKTVSQAVFSLGTTFMSSGQRGLPVLNPGGFFMQWWQPTFLAALSFALVSAPFDMAFFWWTPPVGYKVVGKCVDVFFLLDVMIHFNVAIIHHGAVVTNRKEIAVHYAKTTLILDIVSNIPYDWFFGSEGKGRKLIKLVKLPKLLRFMRLVKMLQEAKAVGVAPTLAGIMLLAHYFSCLWTLIFLGDCDEKGGCPPAGATYLEGVSISLSGFAGSDSWMRLLQNPDTSYLVSTTPPGRGLRVIDELIAVLMTLTGFVLIAALFGNVASSIQGKNGAAVHHKMLLDTRKLEMEAAHIPKQLQAKVEKTYEYLQRFGGSKDGMIRDESLSLDLRRSLASAIYGPTLRKVPLFANIPEVFLRILAQRIEMRLYTPGDYLIMKGEVGHELFMVFSGTVQVVDEDKRVLLDGLKEGSFFGEVCFLQPGSRRSASVLCKEFCRTMVLTLSVFEELNLTSVLDEIREETAKKAVQFNSEKDVSRQHSPGNDDSPRSFE